MGKTLKEIKNSTIHEDIILSDGKKMLETKISISFRTIILLLVVGFVLYLAFS